MSHSVCQMLHSYADEGQTTNPRTMSRYQDKFFFPNSTTAINELPPAQTCTVSPIAPDHRPLRRCLHETSMMKASSPYVFLRYPYRPSLMTLLRRLETYPCVSMSKETQRSNPLVYASIQQHWSPTVKCPVLTVVTTCDTSISQPFFHRPFVDYGRISFYFSTAHDQTFATFDIPLMIPALEATKPVQCVLVECTDHVDVLNLYEIRLRGCNKPIFRIHTFQLAPMTCTNLHDTSLHIPLQHVHLCEHFLLGLSGCRNTPYKINYPALDDPILAMLDDEDLIAIGIAYRQHKSLPTVKPSPYNGYTRPLIPRIAFTKTSRVDVDLSPTDQLGSRRTYLNDWPTGTPLYPPPRQPGEIQLDLINVPPLKFPPGYVLYHLTADIMRCKVTDFINDIMQSYDLRKRSAAKAVFGRMFNCTIEQIRPAKFLDMENFLATVDYQKATLGKAPIWYIIQKEAKDAVRTWTRIPPHDAVPDIFNQIPVVYEPDENNAGNPITVHQSRMSMEDISDMVDIMYDNYVPLKDVQQAIESRLQLEENLEKIKSHTSTSPLRCPTPSFSSSDDDQESDSDYTDLSTPVSYDENDMDDSQTKNNDDEEEEETQQDQQVQPMQQDQSDPITNNEDTDTVLSAMLTPEDAKELEHQAERDMQVLAECHNGSGDCRRRYDGYCNCEDCEAEKRTLRFTRPF